MMPLKHQVCTLKQAKELKELGVELESYFVWTEQYGSPEAKYKIWMRVPLDSILQKRTDYKRYPAYSCAELGILLPEHITYQNEEYDLLRYEMNGINYGYGQLDHYGDLIKNTWQGQIIPFLYEAHIKTELLIKCLREGYIKPEDLKL